MKFRLKKKIGPGKTADILGLISGWLLFTCFVRAIQSAPGTYIAWILLASLFAMLSLGVFGYFEHHIPKPQFSDLMSLFVALPTSGIFAKWALAAVGHAPPVRWYEITVAALGTAVLFEFGQMLIFKIHRTLGRKWQLVTFLEPTELARLRKEIEEAGAAWWIQVRPYAAPNGRHFTEWGGETIVISRKAVRNLRDHPDLLEAHLRGCPIVDLRQLLKEFSGRLDLGNNDAWTYFLASTYQNFPIRFSFVLKEWVEIGVAILLLALLAPLLLLIALGVLVTTGRPVLYRQVRLGYRGRQFLLYKFRSMRQSAETNGPQWASEDDPRITPFGRWLRRTRLDELPQLFNVIRGELSFVGPRPERPEFYQMLNDKIPIFSLRLMVRPGITGWAQVRQGYAGSIEECRRKLEYDLYYIQHMSPQFDFRVMLTTAALMLRGNHGR